MIHNRHQIEEIVRQLMKDIKRQYRENESIQIQFEINLDAFASKRIIGNGWIINVPVNDDQWNKAEPSSILIYIDDDTAEIVSYLDTSMGRPVPMKAIKDNTGKYYLETIPQ